MWHVQAPPVSKAQPAQEAGEEAELAHEEVETDAESVMQGGNLAIAPPNVRVTIKGIPEEGDKAVVILTSPEEGRPIGQVSPSCFATSNDHGLPAEGGNLEHLSLSW